LSNTFYRGADCCVIVFDISDRESYLGINDWKNNFLFSINKSHNLEIPIVLVGNKSDLAKKGERQIEGREALADWVDSDHMV